METEKRPALNKEQAAAAYCEENAVIAAGAGSGKTMVLANRYVWLVTEKKYRVREILTLTFTKKAAAQMYRRIYNELAEKAKKDSGEKGKLARQAIEEFAQARIQTLDSYSAAIVKQAANRYGISPDFAIDEERCRQLAVDEALPFVIANRGHPAMERLYFRKSPMSAIDHIFVPALVHYTYIDSPPDIKRDINNQFAVILDEWKKQTELIREKMDTLAEVYKENENYHPDLAPLLERYSRDSAAFPKEQELRDYFNSLKDRHHKTVIEWAESHPLQKTLTNILNFFLALCGLDMRKGKRKDNPAKEILKELRNLFGEFSSLIVFCMQAGLICSVLTLLSCLQCRYLDRKRAEGILSFSDVARLAKTILLEQRDIRQSEKESFRAIMIDEFQDNNELQKDLLFLLAEKENVTGDSAPSAGDLTPGKLFFVGDEKQSIYRFRGADVSVFRKLKTELGARDLPLSTNYRSAPELIGAFNTVFGGYAFDPAGEPGQAPPPENYAAVFAPEPRLPPYEASYTPLRADKKSAGKLTLCVLDKQDSEDFAEDETELLSPVENEARYVAEKIKILLNEKNETGGQKYRPDDIAILFRARSPQRLFEKHLMRLNVPYANEELNGFFFGGPVDDMMSVLRLAAYPDDRAAYAQMLRSPFAGLSLPGLAVCLVVLDDEDHPQPFDEKPLSLLDDADRERYKHGQCIYQKIRSMVCTENISSLVSKLWYDEGYRYETEWNPRTAVYRELYDYLFHLAVLADEKNQGLAAFTDYIQGLEKTGERLNDIEIPLERYGAVRLLTVHKSKGLEFPVVFLCCCQKTDRNDFSGEIYDTVVSGLTLNPPLPPEFENSKDIKRNYFWERSHTIEKGKKTAELRRLLYVGMTRAENELYLSGCLDVSKYSDDGCADFSKKLKQYIDEKTGGKKENNIAGDSIIDNNTFFGLCLPAFGANIPAEGFGGSSARPFFAIEQIPAYSEQYIRGAEQRGARFPQNQKGLNDFFNMVKPFYEKAEVIETPDIPKKHFSATAMLLHLSDNMLPADFAAGDMFSGKDAADVFGKIDALLDRYAKQYGGDGDKFNYGSFGTIAHICLEALLSGQGIIIPPKIAGLINPKDIGIFLEAGKELALRFAQSPLGIIAGNSKNRKNEFSFRSLIRNTEKEYFINGVIDLVFEDDDMFHVVDFKTDREEAPGEHIPQMACYYRAVSDLFAVPAKKECKTWLYYLRSGHAVDVTGKAKNPDFYMQ